MGFGSPGSGQNIYNGMQNDFGGRSQFSSPGITGSNQFSGNPDQPRWTSPGVSGPNQFDPFQNLQQNAPTGTAINPGQMSDSTMENLRNNPMFQQIVTMLKG